METASAPERQRLRRVGSGADPARDDQLDLVVLADLAQRLGGHADGGECRDPGVLDEDVLGRAGASLQAVDDDDVGSGGDGELHVVGDASGADLHVDRLLPVGGLAQLLDLHHEVVGSGPVRVAAGRALVDPGREACACRRPAR